jgi:spore coat protein H
MKKNKSILLLTSVMAVFLCIIIGLYSISDVTSVDLFDNTYIEKYFDKEKVMNINLEISEEDLKDMDENAIKEEFKLGNVSVNGDVYNNVGVRTKGNSSLTSVANSDSDRYSFKISFDKYNSGQSMKGLSTLNLNNNYSDPSYMREYITYSICKDMGLATPEFAFAKVSINGEYHGLYLAVEDIGDSYLENNFGDTTGELYKAEERATLVYQNDDSDSYSSLVYKGDKKNNSWSNVTKLLKSLKTGEDVEKYIDVDSVLKNTAINTALLNLDSYQGNFAHNYYLYEQDGVFTMLPWDFNMSFGGFGGAGGMSRKEEESGQTANNQQTENQASNKETKSDNLTDNDKERNQANDAQKDDQSIYIDEPTTGSMDERPLVSTILKDSKYKEKYHKYLNEIVTKYLDSDYLENMTTQVADLIDPYVKDDPTIFYSYEDFKKNLTSKVEGSSDNRGQKSTPGILEVAQKMSNTIKSQLSGETSSVKDKNTGETSETSTDTPEDIGNTKDFNNNGENLPQNGDQPPRNGNMPPMNGDIPQKGDLPEDTEVKSSTKNNDPNGANREAPTDKGNSKMGENPNCRGNTKQNLIIVGISILIMIIALIFTKLFRKRRVIR